MRNLYNAVAVLCFVGVILLTLVLFILYVLALPFALGMDWCQWLTYKCNQGIEWAVKKIQKNNSEDNGYIPDTTIREAVDEVIKDSSKTRPGQSFKYNSDSSLDPSSLNYYLPKDQPNK